VTHGSLFLFITWFFIFFSHLGSSRPLASKMCNEKKKETKKWNTMGKEIKEVSTSRQASRESQGSVSGIDSLVSRLVWIGHVFSWVLPLVLGLDAWVFFLTLQPSGTKEQRSKVGEKKTQHGIYNQRSSVQEIKKPLEGECLSLLAFCLAVSLSLGGWWLVAPEKWSFGSRGRVINIFLFTYLWIHQPLTNLSGRYLSRTSGESKVMIG